MPEYRRRFVSGGTFFLTIVTHERRPILRSKDAVARLRCAVAEVMRMRPFFVVGAVALPDHIHFMWELPPNDTDYSTRVGIIKTRFTRSLPEAMRSARENSVSRRKHRESAVWQRRFWEHTVCDEEDFANHMDYIHYNPVKHGHASCPHSWPYSSFRRWARQGYYNSHWLCACDNRRVKPPCFDMIAKTVGE